MERLPIELGAVSNGEYAPEDPGPVAREATRRAMRMADDAARRLGMSRRRFLSTLCGAAVTLVALDGCSRDSGGGDGGRFLLPPESTTDPSAAGDVLSGEEFVCDVQTHLLEGDGRFGSGFPQARCEEGDCFSIERYLEEVFLRSDTSVAILSAIPAADPFAGPLSIGVMEETRRVAAAAGCDGRVLIQGQAVPTMAGALDAMERVAGEHPIVAWKVYTHAPAQWRLDDATGEAFIAKAVALGVPTICVHKGFGADPVDVGPAARAHPEATFVVYHSGYEAGQPEAVDRLLRSLDAAGVEPGANVYAELGSTWFNLMRSPDDAAHVLGKLLRRVGEDRVLWGTDSIWYGSPQGQLQAFRAFEITPEYQERFGYPALTAAAKAKVLGRNAAALFGIDPAGARPACSPSRAELEELRASLPPSPPGGPRTAAAARAVWAGDWVHHV